jgi:hypothetical protein
MTLPPFQLDHTGLDIGSQIAKVTYVDAGGVGTPVQRTEQRSQEPKPPQISGAMANEENGGNLPEITSEMLEAGVAAYLEWKESESYRIEDLVAELFWLARSR